MLGARHAEDGVVYRNQEIGRLSFEPTSKRRLTEVFNDAVANKAPKLARGDPNAALEADNFC